LQNEPLSLPDFKINAVGPVSMLFINRHIMTFAEAINFIRQLPYARNKNKEDLTTVFADNCGTCSTKHALLKQLATENGFQGLQLILGIFKMNAINTFPVSNTLKLHKLEYIPEAHNYLKFYDLIIDATRINSKPSDFVDDLLEEVEITPQQITDFKVAYHKDYLSKWLAGNKNINLTLDEIWMIREQCIRDLSE